MSKEEPLKENDNSALRKTNVMCSANYKKLLTTKYLKNDTKRI